MKNGPYTLVVAPENYPGKKYRGRYCYEHRLVFWKKNGHLPETVHHENTNKRDNNPKNLEGMSRPAHTKLHAKPMKMFKGVCEQCGGPIECRENGSPHRFCSHRCCLIYINPFRFKLPLGLHSDIIH